jgi:hypothetical protein
MIVAPTLDRFGHREGWPHLVITASDQEQLSDPLHRYRCGRDGLRRSATTLFVESQERWRVGVGFPIVDEVHIRERAAAEGPVRRHTAVWSETGPHDIGRCKSDNRADLCAESADQEGGLRSKRSPEHEDPVSHTAQIRDSVEEQLQGDVPRPLVLVWATEPSDRLCDGTVASEEFGARRVDPTAGARHDQCSGPGRALGDPPHTFGP